MIPPRPRFDAVDGAPKAKKVMDSRRSEKQTVALGARDRPPSVPLYAPSQNIRTLRVRRYWPECKVYLLGE